MKKKVKMSKISFFFFFKNYSISILCRAWCHFLSYAKRAVKAGFGHSSTYVDENLFPDYTFSVWLSIYPLLL